MQAQRATAEYIYESHAQQVQQGYRDEGRLSARHLRVYGPNDKIEEEWWPKNQPKVKPRPALNLKKVLVLFTVTIFVICIGMLVSYLSQISLNSARINGLQQNIMQLKSKQSGLQVQLEIASDITKVRDRALHELGMVQSSAGQTRMVTLPEALSTSRMYTADGGVQSVVDQNSRE